MWPWAQHAPMLTPRVAPQARRLQPGGGAASPAPSVSCVCATFGTHSFRDGVRMKLLKRIQEQLLGNVNILNLNSPETMPLASEQLSTVEPTGQP